MIRCFAVPCSYALDKARSLLDTGRTIRKARQDARDDSEPAAEQKHKAVAAARGWLKGQVEADKALPRVEMTAGKGLTSNWKRRQRLWWGLWRMQSACRTSCLWSC